MKTLIALLSTLVIFSSLRAQQPAAPETKPQPTPDKTSPAEVEKSALGETISLIPEPPPTIEKPTGLPQDKSPFSPPSSGKGKQKKALAPIASDVKERIHFREVKTQALKDEKVQADFARIQTFRSDPEKRAAIRQYYETLYARMLKIDSSLKTQIATHKEAYFRQLDQPNVNAWERKEQPQTPVGENTDGL